MPAYAERGSDYDLIDDNGKDSLLADLSNETILTSQDDPLKYLTRLNALRELALRVKSNFALIGSVNELSEKVDEIESIGAEANVIDTVKVNGEALDVENKSVDITVPAELSELENDKEFQTKDEVANAVQTAISQSGHAVFKIADAVPSVSEAESNVMYLVMNKDTGYYDIWMLIDNSMMRINDTDIDLSDYVTKEELDSTIETSLEDYYTKDTVDDKFELYIPYSYIASQESVEEVLDEIFGSMPA